MLAGCHGGEKRTRKYVEGVRLQADPGVGVNTSFTFEVILLEYYIILLFLSYAIFVNIYNITWVPS